MPVDVESPADRLNVRAAEGPTRRSFPTAGFMLLAHPGSMDRLCPELESEGYAGGHPPDLATL